MEKLIWNVIASGLSKDHNIEMLRKIVLGNLLILVGFITLPIFCGILFAKHYFFLGCLDSTFLLFLVIMFFYLRRTKNHDSAAIASTIVIGIFFIIFIIYSGISDKTYYFWVFLYPLVSIFLLGTMLGSFYSLFLLGTACILFVIDRYTALFSSGIIENEIRFVTVYLIVYLIAIAMEKVRQVTHDQLNISNSTLGKTLVEKDHLIEKLQKTINEVTVLRGILPICSKCKKIRDDKGYWHQVETYIRSHSEADFTHGLCPECIKELYPFIKRSR